MALGVCGIAVGEWRMGFGDRTALSKVWLLLFPQISEHHGKFFSQVRTATSLWAVLVQFP